MATGSDPGFRDPGFRFAAPPVRRRADAGGAAEPGRRALAARLYLLVYAGLAVFLASASFGGWYVISSLAGVEAELPLTPLTEHRAMSEVIQNLTVLAQRLDAARVDAAPLRVMQGLVALDTAFAAVEAAQLDQVDTRTAAIMAEIAWLLERIEHLFDDFVVEPEVARALGTRLNDALAALTEVYLLANTEALQRLAQKSEQIRGLRFGMTLLLATLALGLIAIALLVSLQQRTERLRAVASQALADAHGIIQSSINYAATIQCSILPSEEDFAWVFEDHFVLWQPRDRVGGDIYWLRHWGDGVLIGLADCTGHGVHGAFMSLIATGALDRAQADTTPGAVGALVARMHRLIQLTLGQHRTYGASDGGLDLGLCYLDDRRTHMTFCGARFDLLRVDNGAISVIKGARNSIGYRGIPQDQSYRQTQVAIGPGSRFYLATDGLTDQIGGPRRRMFGRKRFLALLADLSHLPLNTQRPQIETTLAQYQGDELRRDDVSVIGFVATQPGA